jgi:hypothetical protein
MHPHSSGKEVFSNIVNVVSKNLFLFANENGADHSERSVGPFLRSGILAQVRWTRAKGIICPAMLYASLGPDETSTMNSTIEQGPRVN